MKPYIAPTLFFIAWTIMCFRLQDTIDENKATCESMGGYYQNGCLHVENNEVVELDIKDKNG